MKRQMARNLIFFLIVIVWQLHPTKAIFQKKYEHFDENLLKSSEGKSIKLTQ